MKYITIVNKNNSPSRWFAVTEARAVEMAVRAGRVRRPENAKVTHVQDLDPVFFPYEGRASLRLAPAPRTFVATQMNDDGTYTTRDQLLGELQ